MVSMDAKALDSSDLIKGQFDWATRVNRIQIVSSLEDSLKKVTDLLPIQKLEEVNWVKAEGDALDRMEDKYSNPRFLKLYNSPEFRHLQLKNHLSNLSYYISCIKSKQISIAMEMYCWNGLSIGLQDSIKFKENIPILIRDGRLSKEIEKNLDIGNDSLGHGYFFGVYGKGIQENVIAPYLKSHTR